MSSSAAFGLVVIVFFLPFVTLSRRGQKVIALTVAELAWGTTVTVPQPLDAPQSRSISPEPLATIAFIAGAAGLVVSFGRSRVNSFLSALGHAQRDKRFVDLSTRAGSRD